MKVAYLSLALVGLLIHPFVFIFFTLLLFNEESKEEKKEWVLNDLYERPE